MKIYVCGDIHGEFEKFEKFIIEKQPDMIFQCGDLGLFPNFNNKKGLLENDKMYKFNIRSNKKIFFCPGNHEDWNYLDLMEDDNEIFSNVFYMKKGSILKLNNKNILFIGGADSIDKKQRLIGRDWFQQEIIRDKDMYNIYNTNENIDIVISHTCPKSVFDNILRLDNRYNDPSQIALDYILEKFHPKKWYFGHFHRYLKFEYNYCEFTMLNAINFTNLWWYDILEI